MFRMVFLCSLICFPLVAAADNIPSSVPQLWDEYDPTVEPLDTEIVREWEEDGFTLRYVTFHIGTFKGVKARMAAFYGFPRGEDNLPGLLHLHGGGQRAFLNEVKFYAQRGYACLSINWGGREMEGTQPGDANTNWGAVDPTQKNVPGYFNLRPGNKYLDETESPRNNNWYLLTVGARRGLTFLAEQTEVDPKKLGVYGHSMGGNLTVYVAGTDKRVRVASPSVGGQGFRTVPWTLLPEQKRRTPNGNVELFRNTLGFQSYAPHIKAPLLWLGATNDFHGIMDDTYRTGSLIPHNDVRYSFTPHMNHRFTPEFAVTRPLWIDQYLKGTFTFPKTPKVELSLNGVPQLAVTPDTLLPVESVTIYYSVDPDPQARFWRIANTIRSNNSWQAELPILSVEQPLFAFANVQYHLHKLEPVPFAKPTSTFALSSDLQTATPDQLKNRDVKATDTPSKTIDDFSKGFQDWYLLSAENPHHWQFWTRKINDPKWRGQPNDLLTFDVRSEQANKLIVVMNENFFRSYRGPQRNYIAVVDLPGGDGWQTVHLQPSDFSTVDDKEGLSSWNHADQLGFAPYYGDRQGEVVGNKQWAGSRPEFRMLRWETKQSE